jgi:hypothetical protein
LTTSRQYPPDPDEVAAYIDANIASDGKIEIEQRIQDEVRTVVGHLLESDLCAPLDEVGAREVERISELDRHVQRHEQPEGVPPALVIDDVLDDDESAARGQGFV